MTFVEHELKSVLKYRSISDPDHTGRDRYAMKTSPTVTGLASKMRCIVHIHKSIKEELRSL